MAEAAEGKEKGEGEGEGEGNQGKVDRRDGGAQVVEGQGQSQFPDSLDSAGNPFEDPAGTQ